MANPLSASEVQGLGMAMQSPSGAQRISSAVAASDQNSGGGPGVAGASNTAITTAGAGTLTAATIAAGIITRTGPTTAYTDTTDTAVAIVAAAPVYVVNLSWEVQIKNNTKWTQTLAGGTGVTLSGLTVVPPFSVITMLFALTSATTVTGLGISISPLTTKPLEVNTSIATVGAGTLTAAGIVGGLITRTGSTAAYTDTTATADLTIAAMPNAVIGMSFITTIKNNTNFPQTITGGTGVTVSGVTIIPPFSVGRFLYVYTAASTMTAVGIGAPPMTSPPTEVSTALTTVGAGTITAAGIAGGVTNRTGSTAAFADTTDTADNIIAARPNIGIGQSWEYTYYNNTLGTSTIGGGTGVTVSLASLVPANCWARFLVTYTAVSTVTMVGIAMGATMALPAAKYATDATGTKTAAAGDLTGADFTVYRNTANGAVALTVRTAALMFGDIPNCQIGKNYMLLVSSQGDNTVTLTADAGPTVTLTGTMTIATKTTRLFHVTFPSTTTCTITSISKGTIE